MEISYSSYPIACPSAHHHIYQKSEGFLHVHHAQEDFLVSKDSFEFFRSSLAVPAYSALKFLSFQTGQSTQTHINNSLSLRIGKFKAVRSIPALAFRTFRGSTNDSDHFINMIQSDQQDLLKYVLVPLPYSDHTLSFW